MSIDWHKLPFVRLLTPVVAGILLAVNFRQIPITWSLGVFFIAFISLFLFKIIPFSFKNRWLYGFLLSVLLVSGGYNLSFYHNELNDKRHFKHIVRAGEEYLIVGSVVDVTERDKNTRLKIALDKIGKKSDSLLDCRGNLLIYLKKDSAIVPPQLGNQIIAFTRLNEIESPKNPMAVDFKKYWYFQNVHYQSFLNSENFKVLREQTSTSVLTLAHKAQTSLAGVLKEYLPTDDEYAVGAALLLGYKDALNDEIKNAYIETGSMHILAVSGMHLLLLFKALEWVLGFYKSGSRRWRWSKTVLLIALIWGFAFLTGLGASIVRAATMSSFLAIGSAMRRNGNIYNVLAASAFFLLLFNPFWLMDIGFQLSYAAVIGIVAITPLIERIFIIENKIGRWIWQSLAVSLAAQIAVTPISIYYFHQFPTYFWLSGLLAVGISDVALLAGIVLFTINFIPFLNVIFGKILFGILWLLNKIILIIQALPFNLLDGFWISFGTVILIYAIIIGFIGAFYTRRLKTFYYPLSFCLILSVLYVFSSFKNTSTRQLIVYYSPRNSFVDIICDKKCYFFSKKFSLSNADSNRIKFVADNYRKYLKVKELSALDFNETVKDNILFYDNMFIQIGSQRGAILDRLPHNRLTLTLDFIVIRDNPSLSIKDLRQKLSFKEVVFDASNSLNRTKKWIIECSELGIEYYNVSEKGAWIKKF